MSMTHDGVCYRNSNLRPVSAETHQSVLAAKLFLLDEGGHYLGDELAIFGLDVSADNDTCTPSTFICEQNRILGVSVDGLAHHSSDKAHVIKCNTNALFKLAKRIHHSEECT
jgi:hypothetical protein